MAKITIESVISVIGVLLNGSVDFWVVDVSTIPLFGIDVL